MILCLNGIYWDQKVQCVVVMEGKILKKENFERIDGGKMKFIRRYSSGQKKNKMSLIFGIMNLRLFGDGQAKAK